MKHTRMTSVINPVSYNAVPIALRHVIFGLVVKLKIIAMIINPTENITEPPPNTYFKNSDKSSLQSLFVPYSVRSTILIILSTNDCTRGIKPAENKTDAH